MEAQPALVARREPVVLRRPWLWAAPVAVVFGATRNLTLPAAVMVVAAGAGIGFTDRWVPRPPRADHPVVRAKGVVVWAAIIVMFCLWELAAFLLGNDTPHPTFSMLAEPMLAAYPIRALAMFGWLAWGWHLSDG